MSNYSAPITATGSLISFYALQGGLIDSLSVPITPTQNLNGYTKPWPAGGGENRFAPIEGSDNLISFVAQPDGSVKISGTGYITKWTARNVTYDLPYNGINAGDTVTIWSDIYFLATPYNGSTSLGAHSSANSVATTFTIPANANKLRLGENAKNGQVQQGEVIDVVGHFFIGKVDSFSSWSPYSNICPLIGLTGLSDYVSPTSDIADATTYSVDWTAEAGTVYGGSYEAVSGELKSRPYIASYNGETLVGPWVSSMDEYAEGATPTTGAQVVDLGGLETTYQLTAQTIQMLVGQNYIWVSTSAVLTLVYRLLNATRITGSTSIGKNAESLTVTPQFNGVSKVAINVTEQLFYEAGNDTGRTITIDCPWGTQAMANNLLSLLQGFQYQPYEASNALLDPAAELGDGLTVNGVYGGIFKMTVRSGALHAVDVAAPQDEEIDHEYPFASSSERKIERQLANVKSELSVQADQIAAKVDREGGDPSSVSWEMNADQFKILSDGTEVLIIDDNGLTVNGDGNFTGEVHAGNIKYGGSSGSFSGRGISGGSLAAGKFTQGVNDQLANADYSADVFSGGTIANYLKAKNIYVTGENAFYVYGSKISRKYLKVTDANGNAANLYYLYWEP